MRLISRLALVCIFICFLILLIQFKLLDFWHLNCLNKQCWPIFDYESEQSTAQIESSSSPVLNQHTKKLPEVLIIGAKKGGTRALIQLMQLHPKILAAKREVHFFDDDTLYAKGLDWYRDQMPFANDQIVVEKTPAYMSKNKCPERVHKFNPRIKLIVILRDPLIRTISDFTQVQHNRLSKNLTLLNFEEMAFKPDGKTLNFGFKPVSNSLYVKHISLWLNYFPLSQFIFLDGDLFIKDPLRELKKVETFLGLKPQIASEQLVFNTRKGFYCFRPRQRLIPKCLGQSKGRKHVNISDTTKDLLKQNFKNYNEQFFQLINRRFDWS